LVVPLKAKKLVTDLVTAYEQCPNPTVPAINASTTGGIDACSPPTRRDPVCGFGPIGKGKAIVTVANNMVTGATNLLDLKVKVVLTNLDGGCNGKTLGLSWVFRPHLPVCASNGMPCTVIDFPMSNSPNCVVSDDGKCVMNGSLDTMLQGIGYLGEFTATGTMIELQITAIRNLTDEVTTFTPGWLLQ
jgi:hypothetical protein